MYVCICFLLFLLGQSQARSAGAVAAVAAGTGLIGTSTSIRLATPQARQRSPVAANAPQVLKVMNTQAGNVPQIITLASARAPGIMASVCICLILLNTVHALLRIQMTTK